MGARSFSPSEASKRLGDKTVPKAVAPAANIPPFKNFRRPLAFKGWPNVTPFGSVGVASSVNEAVCTIFSVPGLFRIFILVRSDLS
jgi:hypothetical protein